MGSLFSVLASPAGVVAIVVVTIGYIIYSYGYAPYGVLKRCGIKGPVPHAIVGNLALQRQGWVKLHQDLRKKYGPVAGHYFGCKPTVMVADAKILETIMIKKFDNFKDRVVYTPYLFSSEGLPNGLFPATGDYWWKMRSSIQPLLSPDVLKMMSCRIQESCDTLVKRLKQHSDTGRSVELYSIICDYSAEICIATLFGREVKIQDQVEKDDFVEATKNAFVTKEGDIKSILILLILQSNFPCLKYLVGKVFPLSPKGRAFHKMVKTTTEWLQSKKQTSTSPKHLFKDGSIVVLRAQSNGHSLRVRNGQVEGIGKAQQMDQFRVHVRSEDVVALQNVADPTHWVRIYQGNGEGGPYCSFRIEEHDGYVMFASLKYPGQYVGIMPDGSSKALDHTGTDDHARFTPESVEKYKDVMRLMMDKGFPDKEIISQTIASMIGVYENLANALGYTLYLLAVNPSVQDRLRSEIKQFFQNNPDASAFDASQKVKYVDMVIMESVRIFTPVPRVTRQCLKTTEFGDFKIPAGAGVEIPIHLIHHDPQIWPDPLKFNPERHTPEKNAKRPLLSLIYFGAGPRDCLGKKLALIMFKMAIVETVRKYQFIDAKIPLETVLGAIGMSPKSGIHLKIASQ